jgi:hypothetical protein
MIYIGNAFSLSMLDRNDQAAESRNKWGGDYSRSPYPSSPEQIRVRLADGEAFTSAVGHADTAAILGELLGVTLPVNRVSIKLARGDTLFVGQYTGPRLPEGTTTLPEGASIEWWAI